MATCPRCDRESNLLYVIPAVVVTEELVERVGSGGNPTDVEICRGCMEELMEGRVAA